MFDGTKYFLQCLKLTYFGGGSPHFMSIVYEKFMKHNLKFWSVTFASILGLNYNLSLIYEKGPIYTKLEFQKMSSSYSGCQSIFQIVFTIISHFGSQLPISSNVLKEETSKGTTNCLLELWSSHFSCRISLLSGVTCNSDTQADWSLHIQYQ